ncbi:hypothetical protein JCM6882_005639 [Rhodosporidiobolus microsporus]
MLPIGQAVLLLSALSSAVLALPLAPPAQVVLSPPAAPPPAPSSWKSNSRFEAARTLGADAQGDRGDGKAPLRNLQVHHPPLVPVGAKKCEVELLRHDFAFSYYEPALASYYPPEGCGKPEDWAAVVLNLTVTSNGTQFDRLASLSLGNVEIWRTSTAEPTRNGIIWTYEKDVTRFATLFAKPNPLIFELNNVIDSRYTGIFSVTLTLTIYPSTPSFPPPPHADLILPVTTRAENKSQMLVYPGEGASAEVEVPENAAEAWLEVIATGAAEEEFWYTNTLDRWKKQWPEAGLTGKGPFREVQVFVDGTIAGVVYPFPVLYTGGANPLLWRPLASLRAFDIPSFFVDVSPFLPKLTDGKKHTISFAVFGQGADETVNSNWFITGALHVVLDPTSPPVRTTGRLLSHQVTPSPFILSGGFPSADGKELKTSVKGTRSVNIVAEVVTGSGKKVVHWGQAATLENKQFYTDEGAYEDVEHASNMILTSSHSNRLALRDTYSFQMHLSTNYTQLSSGFLSADLPSYSYNRALTLPAALGGGGGARVTKSEQRGWAKIEGKVEGRSVGRGETSEKYWYRGEKGEDYWEKVSAVNGTIASRETGASLANGAA